MRRPTFTVTYTPSWTIKCDRCTVFIGTHSKDTMEAWMKHHRCHP